MVATDSFESAVGRSPRAHGVLGMDCEEAALRPLRDDRGQVIVLETGTRKTIDGMRKAERRRCRGGGLVTSVHRASPLPVMAAASDRLERAGLAIRKLDAGAGAALDKIPRVSPESDGRSALTGGAGTSSAIVLAFQRDAKALFLVRRDGGIGFSLGQRTSGGNGRK